MAKYQNYLWHKKKKARVSDFKGLEFNSAVNFFWYFFTFLNIIFNFLLKYRHIQVSTQIINAQLDELSQVYIFKSSKGNFDEQPRIKTTTSVSILPLLS